MEIYYDTLVNEVFIPILIVLTIILHIAVASFVLFLIIGTLLIKSGKKNNSKVKLVLGRIFVGIAILIATALLVVIIRAMLP